MPAAVGYTDLDGQLPVVTQHRWRANLRGGADVEITHAGSRRRMHADLDEERVSVAATLHGAMERLAGRRRSASSRSR